MAEDSTSHGNPPTLGLVGSSMNDMTSNTSGARSSHNAFFLIASRTFLSELVLGGYNG